jgi:hypothetical protein
VSTAGADDAGADDGADGAAATAAGNATEAVSGAGCEVEQALDATPHATSTQAINRLKPGGARSAIQ